MPGIVSLMAAGLILTSAAVLLALLPPLAILLLRVLALRTVDPDIWTPTSSHVLAVFIGMTSPFWTLTTAIVVAYSGMRVDLSDSF